MGGEYEIEDEGHRSNVREEQQRVQHVVRYVVDFEYVKNKTRHARYRKIK